MYVCDVASVMSDSLHTYGLQAPKLLCPWDSPGKNTEVVCHALQGIFPTQGSNPCLLFPALAGRFFTPSVTCKSCVYIYIVLVMYYIYTYTPTYIYILSTRYYSSLSNHIYLCVVSHRVCLTLCDPTYRCINIDIQIINIVWETI